MNEEAAGNFYQRIYIGFTRTPRGLHQQQRAATSGSITTTTCSPGTATSNQFRLAEIIATNVNNALKRITVPPFEALAQQPFEPDVCAD